MNNTSLNSHALNTLPESSLGKVTRGILTLSGGVPGLVAGITVDPPTRGILNITGRRPYLSNSPTPETTWELSVTISDNDELNIETYTLTNSVTIEQEENASTIATFSFLPGHLTPYTIVTVDPLQWVNKFAIVVCNGVELFRGRVQSTHVDITTAVVTLICSNGLQEYFEAQPDEMKTKEQYIDLIGGAWADAIFGKFEETPPWERVKSVLSTTENAIIMQNNGKPNVYRAFASSGPDYSFSSTGVVDESASLDELASTQSVVNKYKIKLEYSYTTFESREIRILYELAEELISVEYWLYPFSVTSNQMIVDAVSSAGWVTLNQPLFEGSGPGGSVYSGAELIGVFVFSNPEAVVAADMSCVARFNRPFKEIKEITIQSQVSIDKTGELRGGANYSLSAELKDDATALFNETEEKTYSYLSNCQATIIDQSPLTFLLPWTTFTCPQYKNSFTKDEITGQYDVAEYVTAGTREEWAEVIRVATLIGTYTILKSHRTTYASFTVLINTGLRVGKTVSLDSLHLVCTGIVYKLTHSFDLAAGKALTTVHLAISRLGADGWAEHYFDPPIPAADTQPVDPLSDGMAYEWNLTSHRVEEDATQPPDPLIDKVQERYGYFYPAPGIAFDPQFFMYFPGISNSDGSADKSTTEITLIEVTPYQDTLTLKAGSNVT